MQVIMSVAIFSLLSSVKPDDDRTRQDELRNGAFSTIAFVIGASTSIISGFLGMKIATYANARTAVEARKGIAPAFAVGKCGCMLPTADRLGNRLTNLVSLCCSFPLWCCYGLPSVWVCFAEPVPHHRHLPQGMEHSAT